MKTETLSEAARAAPPMGVGGLTRFGVTLSDWVLILTAIYTMFLIIDKAPAAYGRLAALWRRIRGKHEQGN